MSGNEPYATKEEVAQRMPVGGLVVRIAQAVDGHAGDDGAVEALPLRLHDHVEDLAVGQRVPMAMVDIRNPYCWRMK